MEYARINLMPQVAIHYTSRSGVIGNVTNVVETGDARKSGRVEFDETGRRHANSINLYKRRFTTPNLDRFLFARN